MAKKSVKKFEASAEKAGFSIGPVVIAILAIALVGGVAWVFFSNSAPQNGFPVEELVDNGHIKGKLDAKVTLVEFSDFQCPACGAAFPTVRTVFEKYKDRIRFVYRHFPLTTIHPFAITAAEASECADQQGKFWELHDALFEQQSIWTAFAGLSSAKSEIRSIAIQIGLEPTAFDQCMASRQTLSKVQADMDAAVRFGINSTPTFFVNGKKLEGALSVDAFSREIDSALAQAN